MKHLMTIVLGVLLLGVVQLQPTLGDEKKNKELLVGTWTLTKSETPNAPTGAIVIFSKDGKLTISIKGEKEISIEGTYTVAGEKINTTMKLGAMEKMDVLTIKELTDKKLVVEDSKGMKDEFMKK
jgi:uncharacterized protein (TIGR03066 family)